MKHLSNYRKFFISLNEELGPPADPKAQEGEEKPEQPKKLEVPDWFKNDKAFFGIADKGDRATLGLDKSMIEPSWEMVKNLQDKVAKKEFNSVKDLQEWLWTQKDMKFGEGTIESHLNDYRKKITPPKGPLTLDKFADGKFGIGTYIFLSTVSRKYKEQLGLSPIPTKMSSIDYSEPKQAAVELKQVVQQIVNKEEEPKSKGEDSDETKDDENNAGKERVSDSSIKGDENTYEAFVAECYNLINPMVVEWEKKGEKMPAPPKKGVVNKIKSIFKKRETIDVPFLTPNTVDKIIASYKRFPEIEKFGAKCYGGDPNITGMTDKETANKMFAETLMNFWQCYKARVYGFSFDGGPPQKLTLPNEASLKQLYLFYMNKLKVQDRSKMGRTGVTTKDSTGKFLYDRKLAARKREMDPGIRSRSQRANDDPYALY